MTRRLLIAALAIGITSSAVLAEEARPAVRISGVRTDDAVVRAQMPEARPFAAIPPPVIPGSYTSGAPMPQGAVMAGPATPMPGPAAPMAAPPTGGGFGMPSPDAPLYGQGSPFTLASPNSTNHKFWVSAEYIYWWTQAPTIPTLVTTGPAASNGILGQPGTQVLLGNGGFDSQGASGGRFDLGYWFGNNQCLGFDLGYFFVSPNSQTFAANSAQYPLLARPFTNLNQDIPFSQLTAYPGVATGNISVTSESEMWGAEANFRRRLGCGSPCFRMNLLAGFRYIDFEETLTITENFARTPNSPPAIGVPDAVSGTVVDQFGTTNRFYGGQIGLASELRRGRWFLNSTAKVALGEMQQTVNISGSQSILLTSGATSTANGGLLALPGANIGSYSQNKFAVVPEVGINLGYNFTPHLRMYVGYNFLYLSSVLRPGEQIDTGLDVTRIPNFPVPGAVPLSTVRPTVPFNTSSMYVQGINFGLQFSW